MAGATPTPPARPLIFLSHAWGTDALGRDVHARAVAFAAELRAQGCSVWIDAEQLRAGHVDHAIATGVAAATFVVICLTRRYIAKVEAHCGDARARDSCGKEWNAASVMRKQRIAVVMEPDLLDTTNWGRGNVSMHLGSSLYVNATDDLRAAAAAVARMVRAMTSTVGPSRTLPRGALAARRRPLPDARVHV